MKKKRFFEKNDLLKLALIFVFISVLLTWFLQTGYFYDGELTYSVDPANKLGFWNVSTPAGIFNIVGIILAVLGYFPQIFTFILVCSGFYALLSCTGAYQRLTTNFADKLKGKETFVIALSMLIFACLAGVVNEPLVLFAIIPFIITIFSKMKLDKITGVSSTFGGVLIGVLGSTYSNYVAGNLVEILKVSYGYELVATIILFAISYVILLTLTILHYESEKKAKKSEAIVDIFTSEEVKGQSYAGLSLVLAVTFIICIISMISWSNAFNISIFEKAFTSVSNAKLFNYPIFAQILGPSSTSPITTQVMPGLSAFGSWDLMIVSGVIIISTLLIKILYRIPFDKVIDSYKYGFSKISKTVVILVIVQSIAMFYYFFPVMPPIVNSIMKTGTNMFTMFASGIFSNIFTVSSEFNLIYLSGLFSTFENVNLGAMALQTSYGIVSFIAPTSLLLMLGLSSQDVKYSEWFKFIWKFVIAILIASLIVLAIIAK